MSVTLQDFASLFKIKPHFPTFISLETSVLHVNVWTLPVSFHFITCCSLTWFLHFVFYTEAFLVKDSISDYCQNGSADNANMLFVSQEALLTENG